jgi:hypothetical protein
VLGIHLSTDVRLTRVFSIRERVRLGFMAEAFNLFNVANLSGDGNGLVQTAAFGPSLRSGQLRYSVPEGRGLFSLALA